MARSRPEKTLADYLAIAVTPVLIMLLVGSLVFFLNELVPSGRYGSRIRWILFWFVLGMVLVARIAIESGRAQASAFTLVLGAVTSIAIFKFVPDAPWVPIVCLAIIWWCADKLTWDCTLIDDSEDASGEGLLQVAGVADEAELKEAPDGTAESPADVTPEKEPERVPFWKRVFLNTSEREGKPHAPGLWVVYFSLAALPLFGFGQLAIPQSDEVSRDFAFRCLLVYVGAGLGLLMLTSFLGLRRYLRQRGMQMPGTMAATWVGMGAAIALGILVTALLLPRPDSDYSLTAMIDSAGDQLQEASDRAFLDDDGGEGEGQQNGPADEQAEGGEASDPGQQGQPGGQQPGDQTAQNSQQDGEDGRDSGGRESGQGQGGDSEGQQNDGNQTAQKDSESGDQDGQGGEQDQGQSGQGDQQTARNDPQGSQDEDGNRDGESGEQREDDEGEQENAGERFAQNEEGEQGEGEESSGDDPSSSSADSSSFMSQLTEAIGTLFKWIVYGIMAAIALYLVIRNWQSVANLLLRLWHEFLSLFGRRSDPESEAHDDAEEPAAAPERPFSAFRNPFRSGAAAQHSPAELIRYTFEALQAWASENGCGRSADQTPMEFGQQLRTRRRDDIGQDAHELSQLYAGVAYGGVRPRDDSFPLLERLWSRLSQA